MIQQNCPSRYDYLNQIGTNSEVHDLADLLHFTQKGPRANEDRSKRP